MRVVKRAAVLVLAVWVVGFGSLVVRPAYAATKEAIQNVFITNTANNPVPVAPQGTTNVTGTVTVANPTPPASQPILVQKHFGGDPITAQHPFAYGQLYQVPAGKVLTVEYFQARWLFSGVHMRQGELIVGCGYQPSTDANIDNVEVFLEDQDAGIGYHVLGGPMKLVVPSGSCLNYDVGAVSTDIGDNGTTLYMYGGFTGYLTDAPA